MAMRKPVTAPDVEQAMRKLHDFFESGDRTVVAEITIDQLAVDTIADAVFAFKNRPVPLITALSQLTAFHRRFNWNDAPASPPEPIHRGDATRTHDPAVISLVLSE